MGGVRLTRRWQFRCRNIIYGLLGIGVIIFVKRQADLNEGGTELTGRGGNNVNLTADLIISNGNLARNLEWTELTKSAGNSSTTDPIISNVNPDEQLRINTFNVCVKGKALVDREFMIAELPKFIEVYNKRPGENKLGTKFAHQFAMWCTVRKLKPRHIIESGIYQGFGSWILRQAAPDAQLILLDPRPYLQYVDEHPDTVYLTGKRFVDFAKIDWLGLGIDVTRSLVYFDDHQSGLIRAHQAYKRGFRYIMFDDNYSPHSGDNFSLKKACAIKMGLVAPKSEVFKTNFGKLKRSLQYADMALVDYVFDSHITHYMEFPLPWASDDVMYDTLIKNNNADKKYSLENPDLYFNKPSSGYRNVCLVMLNN